MSREMLPIPFLAFILLIGRTKAEGANIGEVLDEIGEARLLHTAHMHPCPTIPVCDCADIQSWALINCKNKNLIEIPRGIPEKTTDLWIGWNDITAIPDNSFKNLSNLLLLDLQFNAIANLSKDSFNGLTFLKTLRLTGNQIRYTDSFQNSLMKLVSLVNLEIQQSLSNISDNEIFPSRVLQNIPKLENLSIDGLNMRTLNFTLENLRKLKIYKVPGAISRCNVKLLKRHLFSSLFPSVEEIVLQNCQLQGIERGSFEGLPALRLLDLSFNKKLGFQVLPNLTSGMDSPNFTDLRLTQVHYVFGVGISLSKEFMMSFTNISLKHLEIDQNRISYIDEDAVPYIPSSLETLSIGDNELYGGRYIRSIVNYSTCIFRNLTHLNVSYQIRSKSYDARDANEKYQNDKGKWNGIDNFSELDFDQDRESDNKENEVGGYVSKNSKCENCRFVASELIRLQLPEMFESLDLTASIAHLPSETGACFCQPNSLKVISASDNRFTRLTAQIFGLSNLTTINMSRNSCSYIDKYFFHNFPSLTELNASGNYLGYALSLDMDGVIFSKSGELQSLDLSDNKIQSLPSNVFRGLTNIRCLNLSSNLLKTVEVSFSHMKKLELLCLDTNFLESLSKITRGELDAVSAVSKIYIDLSKNDLKCTCEEKGFWLWMTTTKVRFIRQPNYQCTLQNGTQANLTDVSSIFKRLETSCTSNLAVTLIISFIFVFLIGIVASAVIYRYRWNLRYMYYTTKFKLKGYTQLGGQDNAFEYDAFLSYSDNDRDFVFDKLIPELQDKRGVRLCVHERDFKPGTVVIENMMRAITTSHKTLILMSKSFVQSQWCRYELRMARMESVNMDRDILCVVKIEKVVVNKLPIDLINILRNHTYIELPKEDTHMETFWNRLREALVI